MAVKGRLSKRILAENAQFSPITWEHSHVVMDEHGQPEVLLRLLLAEHGAHTGAR